MQDLLSQFVEPLTARSLDRLQRFDCGDPGINAFAREHAWRQQEKLLNRTYLIRHNRPDACPGFISLSAAQITSELTGLSRNQLVYESAPALLVARMGVDRGFQRQGLARDLLAAARLMGRALSVGCRFLVLHARHDNLPALSLYRSERFRVPDGQEPDDNGLLLMFFDLARPA